MMGKTQPHPSGMPMHFKKYLGVALLLLIVVFTVQNATVVTVRFLFWDLSLSRALMIFFVFAAGVLVGLVARRA